MIRIRTIICACLLLAALALGAQTSPWEHYSYGEYVLSMAQRGNTLLFGTKTGLVKYDLGTGQKQILNKVNSPLPDNWVSAVAIAPSGVIWLGTGMGICRVENDNWQIFTTSNTTLPSNYTQKILFAPDGTLWAVSRYNANYDYMYSYDGSQWTVHSHANTNIPGQQIQDFTLDENGHPGLVYYNSSNDLTGLAVWNGGTWINHSGVSMGVTSNYLAGVTHDGAKFWMTDWYRIYSWDGVSGAAFDPDTPLSQNPQITSLGIDNQGNLLAAYYDMVNPGYPAYLLKFDGANWSAFDPNPQVAGLMWPNAVLQTPDSRIWIGAGGGVAVFDGVNWEDFVCSNSGLPSNNIYSMALDNQDKLWMAIQDYLPDLFCLVKKEGENWTVYGPDQIPGLQRPEYIAAAPDGAVWFSSIDSGTNEQVTRFDCVTAVDYNSTNSTLPPGFVNALEVDPQGNVWVAMRRSQTPFETEFHVLDGANWHPVGTTTKHVRDIELDAQGWPWYATDEGLLHMEGNALVAYDTANSGLTNNDTRCLALDVEGNLWIGMENGLAKHSSTGAWQSWDSNTGNYPHRTFNDLTIDAWGRVWGATESSGLLCFAGENWTSYTTQNSPLPTPGLKNVQIDSQNRLWINSQWQGICSFQITSTPADDLLQNPAPDAISVANYPNPFNPSTTVSFRLPSSSEVQMDVFNVRGQRVRQLMSGSKAAGSHSVPFDGRDDNGKPLASGIYLVKISAGKLSATHRIMLMK